MNSKGMKINMSKIAESKKNGENNLEDKVENKN